MRLHNLSPSEGSRRPKIRKGRGVGSGKGKTAGRGTKGQNSRSGGGVRPGYEGGQMPLHRRLPKRGFANIFRKQIAVVNIGDLSRFETGSLVDTAALMRCGLVKGRYDGIKLLAHGNIDYPLTIHLDRISKKAREKILKAGGSVKTDIQAEE